MKRFLDVAICIVLALIGFAFVTDRNGPWAGFFLFSVWIFLGSVVGLIGLIISIRAWIKSKKASFELILRTLASIFLLAPAIHLFIISGLFMHHECKTVHEISNTGVSVTQTDCTELKWGFGDRWEWGIGWQKDIIVQ